MGSLHCPIALTTANICILEPQSHRVRQNNFFFLLQMNNVEFLSLNSITDDSCHAVLCKNNMCISDCIERHVHVSGKVMKAVAVAFALLHITRIPLSFTPCRCIADVSKDGSATWCTIYAPQLAKLITFQPLHQTLVDRGDAPENRPATTSAAHSATLSLRSS